MDSSRPRYSDRPFPPYSYVPGQAPHPVSNPAGHMHGTEPDSPPRLQPDAWRNSAEFLYGVDLFNHGYFWESHEAWESLWHAADRQGVVADFLKGLIKLAAAGVKFLEGNHQGVRRHAARAVELLTTVVQHKPTRANRFCGIQLEQLIEAAKELPRQDIDFKILIQLERD